MGNMYGQPQMNTGFSNMGMNNFGGFGGFNNMAGFGHMGNPFLFQGPPQNDEILYK